MLKKIFLASVIAIGAIGGIIIYEKSKTEIKEIKPEKPNTEIKTGPATNLNKNENLENTNSPNNEKVLDILKQVATAQNIWSQENGCYEISLLKLDEKSKVSKQLKELLLSQKSKKEIFGHTFTDLTDDKDTNDTRAHYGLQATPINATSGKSFLLIMDLNQQLPFEEKKPSNKQSEEIQLYESGEIKTVLTTWPTTAELSKWTRIKPNAPQEPLKP